MQGGTGGGCRAGDSEAVCRALKHSLALYQWPLQDVLGLTRQRATYIVSSIAWRSWGWSQLASRSHAAQDRVRKGLSLGEAAHRWWLCELETEDLGVNFGRHGDMRQQPVGPGRPHRAPALMYGLPGPPPGFVGALMPDGNWWGRDGTGLRYTVNPPPCTCALRTMKTMKMMTMMMRMTRRTAARNPRPTAMMTMTTLMRWVRMRPRLNRMGRRRWRPLKTTTVVRRGRMPVRHTAPQQGRQDQLEPIRPVADGLIRWLWPHIIIIISHQEGAHHHAGPPLTLSLSGTGR